jgi:hypothetical protein
MQDGVHENISIEDYHNNTTHLSSTQLKIAKRSLKEFDWVRSGKIVNESKPHFDFGNAFELALVDPLGFSERVAIAQDLAWVRAAMEDNPDLKNPRNTSYYKAKCLEFKNANKGKYCIDDVDYEKIKYMLESCIQDKIIQGLIKNVEAQLSLFWTDDQTGLKLKTRPDICKRKKNVVVNIKTAEDGSPKAFSRDLAKYDYPLQACIEITGCLATGLMTSVDNYFWLVVEKEAPFNATIYEFSPEDQKACMVELEWLIEKLTRAKEKNFYPGYSDRADNQYGILTAEIPMYYKLTV